MFGFFKVGIVLMALTDAGLTIAGTVGEQTNTPPVITSTPDPTFMKGTASTYDMSQNFTDDGLSIVLTSLTNILPNGLSYNGNTRILSYDGIGIASTHVNELVVDDQVNAPVTSSPFNIAIQEAFLTLNQAAYSGNENTDITFVIVRTGSFGSVVDIDWSIAGASVIAPTFGTERFTAGLTTINVTVTAQAVSSTEVGTLTLSNVQTISGNVNNQLGTPSVASFTILDVAPSLYVGFGAVTNGADDFPSGPTTYNVTNLNNSGVGSFRDAISVDGRNIVFDVGGTINVTSSMQISKSFLTIDGSTAPSPGITLSIPNQRLAFEGSGGVDVHDIIVNNIRSVGNGNPIEGKDHWEMDGSAGDVYNIVLDHLTMQGSGDGNVDMYGAVHDVTLSNSLIFDSIQGQHFSNSSFNRDAITVYRNVYAKLNERQPRIRYNTKRLEFVNNIIYGWGWTAGGAAGMNIAVGGAAFAPSANVENNLFHHVSGLSGSSNDALIIDGSLFGDWFFAGNVWPTGETQGDSASTSGRVTIPATAQVTRLATNTLTTDVLPTIGTQFKTAEETALINEISTAIGVPPPPIGQTQWRGIPDPVDSFGWDPINIVRPSDPGEWPSAVNSSWYYLDDTHGSATDTANPNGYRDKPRLTPPSSMSAGDRLIIGAGGPYSFTGTSYAGTSANPILIFSDDVLRTELSAKLLFTTGDAHVLFDGFFWDQTTGINQSVKVEGSGASFICVRNSLHFGDNIGTSNGSAMSTNGDSTANHVHHIVLYNNTVRNIMVADGTQEVDFLGFVPRANCDSIWILDCNSSELGGDSVRTGSNVASIGSDDPGNLIYIGGCDFGNNGENPIDCKYSTNIIISENILRDAVVSASSAGEGIVMHESSIGVWIIFNQFRNCRRAVNTTTVSGGAGDVFVIGNVFDFMNDNGGSGDRDGLCMVHRCGDSGLGNGQAAFVDNTCYNYARGVYTNSNNGSVWTEFSGNVFKKRYVGAGTQYDLWKAGSANPWSIDRNIFEDKLIIGSSLTAETNTIDADPLLVDPANDDFTLQASSQAIDSGKESPVYALFESTYGINIRVDRDGNTRPSASLDWDRGAHEKI